MPFPPLPDPAIILPLGFDWRESGINNKLPAYSLDVGNGDYVAKVYNSFADSRWCAILNQRGTRDFPTADAARSFVEAEITAAVQRRVQSAMDTIGRYTSLHCTPAVVEAEA